MNISIVRAFIALRQFAMNYRDLADQVAEIRRTVQNHDEQLNKIYQAIEYLLGGKRDPANLGGPGKDRVQIACK